MAENSQNVFVASPKAGGAVWSAPAGTEIPTDAVTPLSAAFHSLGYISEDGIVNAEETDTNDIKAYGGKVVATVQTSRKETYQFTPIETNKHTLAERYGDDNLHIDEKGNIAVDHNAKRKPSRVYVFETVLSDNKVQRDVVPLGRVTNVGDRTYKDGEAIAGSLTLTCEEDAAGNTAYTHIAEIVPEDEGEPEDQSLEQEVTDGGN